MTQAQRTLVFLAGVFVGGAIAGTLSWIEPAPWWFPAAMVAGAVFALYAAD